ncbi:MAG: hypothetical protein A2X94_08965 [Bdellovibrionales bacterium GWB1_55_8]|nr:MAG: hypothetical protein A2X94_08965 [Bdellovibrionales bacterium GWB1_55_8]
MSLDSSPSVAKAIVISEARQRRRSRSMVALAVLCAVAGSVAGITFPAPTSAAPYSGAELKSAEGSQEVRVRELREQEITQLRIALGRRLAKNRRADLYFRLAEIYVEAYRAAFLLEGRAHEKRLERGKSDKYIDRSHSRPFLSAGIKACNEVLKIGIGRGKLDQIYYFLGFSYSELGDRKKSADNFRNLVQRFPASPFASEAYRELGEDSFSRGDFRKAQAYYEMAVKRSTADDLPRTLHKLAWSYYRTKQYGRAVGTLKQAVEASGKSGEKFLSLREESLRDMAVFMTESGQVDEAIAYFQDVAGDKSFYPGVLEKLGKQYERNVEPAKATQVYESLLKTQPDSEAAFRVRVKLVDLDLRRGHYQNALKRLQGDLKDGGEEETRVAAQNLRAMIRRTATEHHEKFRKKSNRSELEISEAYYQAYLQHFLAKDDPRNETPEIRMYLAEVKRELGKSGDASALYRQVLDSRDQRYAKEAGALWTSSLAEAIRDNAKNGQKKSGKEPSELEKEYVQASDRLQEALSGTVEAREAALKAAQVFGGYSETHPEAIKRSRKIIESWPKTPQALVAARLWLQIVSDHLPQGAAIAKAESSRIDDLVETLGALRANEALLVADKETGRGKLKAQLEEQEERIRIWRIARNEEDKDYASAGKGYEALAASASRRDFAEKAFGSAVAAYLRAGDVDSLERTLQAWVKRFPGATGAAEHARLAATTLLIQGKQDQSARIFERIAKELQDPESLETAARIWEAMPDVARAERAWKNYLASFPKAKGRWKAALTLGLLQQALGKDVEARKSFELCAQGPDQYESLCRIRIAELFLKNKDQAHAQALLRKVALRKNSKSDPSSAYVAYARYQLADWVESGTRFEKLELPEAVLKRAMNERLGFLEPLSRAYMSAVEAGGPWAVAALGKLASWAMQFAHDVDAISPPASYNAEAITQFRKNLETISTPLRKKAIVTWSDGYANAVAAEALSPALPELADHLADTRIQVPGRAQGPQGKFRIAGLAADGGEIGKEKAFENVRGKLLGNPRDADAWVDYGNLLWGDGKSQLAKLAYERALSLNPKNPAALNNRAVVELSGTGQEDWIRAAEASQLLLEALKQEPFYIPAKFNRASLLNYYRLFSKARPLWEQVIAKDSSGDAHQGLAVALQGLGETSNAISEFRKAAEKGASSSDFTAVYHEAARHSWGGVDGAEECLDRLEDLDKKTLHGFEKRSVEHLLGICTLWKKKK